MNVIPGPLGQSLATPHLGMHALPLGPAVQPQPLVASGGQALAAEQSLWVVQATGPWRPPVSPLSESMLKYPRALPKAM